MTEAIIVLLVFARFLFGGSESEGPQIPTRAFYTVDDGRTWFADDIEKMAPFEKDGKTAYRVYVYTCDDGKTQFVSHLERYTPQALKMIATSRAKHGGLEDPRIYEEISMTGMEVKAPGTGDQGWVKQGDFERAANVTEPRCPHNRVHDRALMPVMPD